MRGRTSDVWLEQPRQTHAFKATRQDARMGTEFGWGVNDGGVVEVIVVESSSY